MGGFSGHCNGRMISGPPIAARPKYTARLLRFTLGKPPGARGLKISEKKNPGPKPTRRGVFFARSRNGPMISGPPSRRALVIFVQIFSISSEEIV